MPVKEVSDFQDLVLATLADLKRPKFAQIAQDIQRYVMMRQWLRKDRITIDSGKSITRTVMDTLLDVAEHVGLWQTGAVTFGDHFKDLNVPWRIARKSFPVNEIEVDLNSGQSMVRNVIVARRANSIISLAKALEEAAWSSPAAASKVLPFGLRHWIVTNSSQGFNGGNPSGYNDTGGIDRDTSPNFKNYTDQYTNMTRTDGIRKMRQAFHEIHWESPTDEKDFEKFGRTMRLYIGDLQKLLDIQEAAENQNDRLGSDIDSMNGVVRFNRLPFQWVPFLGAESPVDDTIYMINNDSFRLVVLKNWILREKVLPHPNHPLAVVHWTHLVYNFICLNPRLNAAIQQG